MSKTKNPPKAARLTEQLRWHLKNCGAGKIPQVAADSGVAAHLSGLRRRKCVPERSPQGPELIEPLRVIKLSALINLLARTPVVHQEDIHIRIIDEVVSVEIDRAGSLTVLAEEHR